MPWWQKLPGYQQPYKQAIIGQYGACTGIMLAAAAQYRPGAGPSQRVYREVSQEYLE